MIPEPGEYLSVLMGAPTLSELELEEAGVRVLRRIAPGVLGLLVPASSVRRYHQLVRAHLEPGFWNDLVGRDEILFVFKLRDGVMKEFTLCDDNREEIARLCSELNGDPFELTSDLPRYFAANPFYRDVMLAFHGGEPD